MPDATGEARQMHLQYEGRTAAIFSNNSHNISKDRLSLVHLGVSNIRVFSSWGEAESFFGEFDVDFALVDSSLHDMHGDLCIRKIRKAIDRHTVPIVMVTEENRREKVLTAISAGCGGYVLRPYSMNTMEKHLTAAVRSSRVDEMDAAQLAEGHRLVQTGQFDQAMDEFEDVLEGMDEATRLFERGMDFLSREKFGKAIVAFNKALALNQMFAEACKGLAHAHKGKGDDEEYSRYLQKAADIYAAQDRMDEVKAVFVEILKDDPDAVNPFNKLGVKLRREGDYPGALSAYTKAMEVTPDDPNLLFNIAKARLYADDREGALEAVSRSLSLDPDLAPARELRDKLKKALSRKKKIACKGHVAVDRG